MAHCSISMNECEYEQQEIESEELSEGENKAADVFTANVKAETKHMIDKNYKFAILHKTGDLFKSPSDQSLVHCVSKDLRMGKGIATLFKKKFSGVTELKKQVKRVGDVGVLEREGRYIYYLITKEKYHQKPTYESLEKTLNEMKRHCSIHNVTKISMPKIGCGLDKLEWRDVEGKLIKVFQDTDIVMTVYSF